MDSSKVASEWAGDRNKYSIEKRTGKKTNRHAGEWDDMVINNNNTYYFFLRSCD